MKRLYIKSILSQKRMGKTTCCKVLVALLLTALVSSVSVTVNKLDGVSSKNLVYSGFLPISDSSTNQLFFTYYGKQNSQ